MAPPECVVYKAGVLNPSSNSNKKNDKKSVCGFNARFFQTRYYDRISSFTNEIYRHKTSLFNYVWEVKNKFRIDPILKWEIMKRCSKYKGVDGYCKLCMEEKLTIAIYNRPKELLNQKSEVFNIYRHRKNYLNSG